MSKTKKILISCFIVFNLLTMVRDLLPLQAKPFKTLYKPIDSYLSFFSIYQDWVMFAPNPSRLNVYMTAEVEFMDGSKDTFEFPRAKDLNILEKYFFGEKYRKLISESIRKDDHSWAWKDTAKFAMRKLRDKNFGKIPSKVHLIRHWDEVPDFDKEFRPHLSQVQNYKSFKFYTHEVL